MAQIDVSGTVVGEASLEGSAVRSALMLGSADGSARGVGLSVRLLATSGFAHGCGLLRLWHEDAAGHAHGIGMVSGVVVRSEALYGALRGRGRLVWSRPMPLRGRAVLVAYMESFRVPAPICLAPAVCAHRCKRGWF